MLSMEVAIAKTHKYASRDSGDTAETVERPTGGLSAVVVDGQGSGSAAKSLSMMVSSKAVTLLKEGVRDGAVARGTHDFLHAYRHGKVSATLDIISVDLVSSTLIVTRNNEAPYLVAQNGQFVLMAGTASPVGLYRHTKPTIDQFPLVAGLAVIVFTDGIMNAGERHKQILDPLKWANARKPGHLTAHELADGLLAAAMSADRDRPNDDMTVAAATIGETEMEQPIRTLRVSVPFKG